MGVFRAKESFSLPGPIGRVITAGSLISDDDPDYKGREHLFEGVEASVKAENVRRTQGFTEDASADPNQKRTLTPPGGRGASPSSPDKPADEKPADEKPADEKPAEKSAAEKPAAKTKWGK